uniref:hypothetical protein n=1 Tax=Falsirhodobacter xinxiangensis TaxID=2530049 RepID=UPI00145ACB09|nr:hypothetical protein [Rhodobacter xinxiangensis]
MIAKPDGTAFAGRDMPWKGRRRLHRQNRRWVIAWSAEQIFPKNPENAHQPKGDVSGAL